MPAHGKKGNPNPVQTDEFKKKRFQPYGTVDQPLSNRVLGVRLPLDVDAILFAMPPKERVAWVRKIITDAVRQEAQKSD